LHVETAWHLGLVLTVTTLPCKPLNAVKSQHYFCNIIYLFQLGLQLKCLYSHTFVFVLLISITLFILYFTSSTLRLIAPSLQGYSLGEICWRVFECCLFSYSTACKFSPNKCLSCI